MAFQLPADCLKEIIEFLEKDKNSLRSCLLVNRLWCTVAVRILWRNVWNIQYSIHYNPYRKHVPLLIISTIIACLPNESKNLLSINGIFIPTPTTNLPLFDYISFIKVLCFRQIERIVEDALINQKINTSNNKYLVLKELLKAFMNQIPSLKVLNYNVNYSVTIRNIPFVSFPKAKDCLIDLLEFKSDLFIYPEHIYQLSQICHNIQTLSINLHSDVSNGIKDLIFSQNSLKSLGLVYKNKYVKDIIPVLSKHHNTLTKLHIHIIDENMYTIFSFISSFRNLQELVIFSTYIPDELQHMIFPNLQVFRFIDNCDVSTKILIKFLENNGRTLTDLCIDGYADKSLNLSIIQCCSNLKNLFIIIEKNELDILKSIFDGCQYLESIKILCGGHFINEKEMLGVIAKYSPKNFYKLKINNYRSSQLLLEELESFFIGWGKRTSQKSLTLITTTRSNITIIEKYKKLDIVKEFKTETYDLDEYLID